MEIIKFTQKYFDLFEKYKKEILKLLPTAQITLAGSLACIKYGKDEIDILIEVEDLENSFKKLSEIYSPGPIDEQVGYLKKIDGSTRMDLQCHKLNCGAVKQKKKLTLLLQKNINLKNEYETLKLNSTNLNEEEYKKSKHIFFTKLIEILKEKKKIIKN